MNHPIICRVVSGQLDDADVSAFEMALDDLRAYWDKAFGIGAFILASPRNPQSSPVIVGRKGWRRGEKAEMLLHLTRPCVRQEYVLLVLTVRAGL